MAEGVVKWFNSENGHGVLAVLGHAGGAGGRDIDVHYSDIQMNGYKKLDAVRPVHRRDRAGPSSRW